MIEEIDIEQARQDRDQVPRSSSRRKDLAIRDHLPSSLEGKRCLHRPRRDYLGDML